MKQLLHRTCAASRDNNQKILSAALALRKIDIPLEDYNGSATRYIVLGYQMGGLTR